MWPFDQDQASAPGRGIQVNENENPLDYRLGC